MCAVAESGDIEKAAKVLVNAVLVDVESAKNHLSGNATNQELTPAGQFSSTFFPTLLNFPAKLFGQLPQMAFFRFGLSDTVSRITLGGRIYTLCFNDSHSEFVTGLENGFLPKQMLVFLRFQSPNIEPSLSPFAKWDMCQGGGQHTIFLYSRNTNSLAVEFYLKGAHRFDYNQMKAGSRVRFATVTGCESQYP
jgi:hypothetical protein